MISIVIPTYNNLDYLKLCLKSLKRNSSFNHEIIIHINNGSDGTLDFIKANNYKYTSSDDNIGLCSSINKAAKLVTNKYILYSHDDMYFCPDWDKVLSREVKSFDNDNFYLSGTMIEPNSGHIIHDFGSNLDTFREDVLLSKYKNSISNKKLNINLYYQFSKDIPNNYSWYSIKRNNEFMPSFTKQIFKQVSVLF